MDALTSALQGTGLAAKPVQKSRNGMIGPFLADSDSEDDADDAQQASAGPSTAAPAPSSAASKNIGVVALDEEDWDIVPREFLRYGMERWGLTTETLLEISVHTELAVDTSTVPGDSSDLTYCARLNRVAPALIKAAILFRLQLLTPGAAGSLFLDISEFLDELIESLEKIEGLDPDAGEPAWPLSTLYDVEPIQNAFAAFYRILDANLWVRVERVYGVGMAASFRQSVERIRQFLPDPEGFSW
jgi:hypothetical protein